MIVNDMEYKYQITILTPTYNRGDRLPVLYESLCRQTVKEFQWLIIDDGSTDKTPDIVRNFDDPTLSIDYHVKSNGGKHTAINYSCPYIKGEMVCIVDSDDWLVPSAIEEIMIKKTEYSRYSSVKVLSFLRGKALDTPLSDCFPNTEIISNHIDFRINAGRLADCCEVIYTDVLKEFPFPEFAGETFMGEGYLWNHVGFKYDTAYINKVIYICEYLDGGLTKSGRRLRLMSPNGGMANCNSFYSTSSKRRVSMVMRIKEALLFVCYGRQSGLSYSKIMAKASDKLFVRLFYVPGIALHSFWKCKYLGTDRE